MTLEQIAELESQTLMSTYERLPLLAVRGEGCFLFDAAGKKYLDFLGGLAVNALGYNHHEMMTVLRDESETLLHVSNLIYHRFQAPLAQKLAVLSGLDRVFFANTGSEAVEGAMKLARAYARRAEAGSERFVILALENSFHGRTLGALSATWPEKYRKPFEPLVPGVEFVRANDLDQLKQKFSECVAAILVEVIQGEGGVVELEREFLQAAEHLARAHDALFICDEIQCGLGRTGRFFAYQKFGLQPDIVVVAKPLAGGLPLAAVLARNRVAEAFHPGLHGSTFGGGPLQCRLALKFLEIIERPGFLEHVREVGEYFRQKLLGLQEDLPVIQQVRGDGLMLAAQLAVAGKEAVQQGLQAGLIFNCTQERVLRFLPPLIVEKQDVDQFTEGLRPILQTLPAARPKGAHA